MLPRIRHVIALAVAASSALLLVLVGGGDELAAAERASAGAAEGSADADPTSRRKRARPEARPKAPKPELGALQRHRLVFGDASVARAKALTPLERPALAPFEAMAEPTTSTWPQTRFDPARWTSWTPGFTGTAVGPRGLRVDLATDADGLRFVPSTGFGPATATVLVCGDENVAYARSAADGLAGALQSELAARPSTRGFACVDASAPGQFPDAYAATTDVLSARDTRVVVVAFDPESDFAESAKARRGPRQDEQRTGRVYRGGGLPVAKRQMVRHVLDVLCELQRRCEVRDCTLLVAMLPARPRESGAMQDRMVLELVASLRARSIRTADLSLLRRESAPLRDAGTGLVDVATLKDAARLLAIEIAMELAPKAPEIAEQ